MVYTLTALVPDAKIDSIEVISGSVANWVINLLFMLKLPVKGLSVA
jgi:hypothetical protein